MKLYATVKNCKGKKEGMGDNIQLDIYLSKGNTEQYYVGFTTEGIMVYENGKIVFDTVTSEEMKQRRTRLEHLRKELRAERISYGELAELQGLADYIEDGDVELLEAAGVPEHKGKEKAQSE